MTYAASAQCVQKLCNLESFRPHVYSDGGGLPTIGYGRRCDADALPCQEPVERLWLCAYLTNICRHLETALPGLLPHQVDALCLFIYNTGWDAFAKCDTFKLLKAHHWEAFAHWGQWIHDAKGRVEGGLVTRRAFEIALFIWGWPHS